MSRFGGWIDGGGALLGEKIKALSRTLGWNGIGWREGVCQRAFGLVAVAEKGSEPRPILRKSESGNLVLFWGGAPEGGGEAILRAYGQRSRASFADSLDGSFAFALLDEGRGEMVLARSRDGETPLYYAQEEHRMIFSTEIKGVLCLMSDPPKIGQESLRNFLEYPPEKRKSESLYSGVFAFPTGQTVIGNRFGRVCVSHSKKPRGSHSQPRRETVTLPRTKESLARFLFGEMMQRDAPMFTFPPCNVRERKEWETLLWEILSEWDPMELTRLCGEDFRSRIERERGDNRINLMANLCQAMQLLYRF